MTDHDIQLLAIGAAIGMYITLLAMLIGGILSGRRDRKAARAAESLLKGAERRAAEPHPAELVEACTRDFELELRDGLDRVEDAARRDGLL